MPLQKLTDYLDQNGIKYLKLSHSPAFTAQEVAASAHITGKRIAKTVIVTIDGKLAMMVLPADEKVYCDRLREETGAAHVALASEDAFSRRFPGAETGAMPPFGNLYGMDVYVSPDLAGGEIAFNAGSHREIIVMSYDDFARLVRPRVVDFAAAYQGLGSR